MLRRSISQIINHLSYRWRLCEHVRRCVRNQRNPDVSRCILWEARDGFSPNDLGFSYLVQITWLSYITVGLWRSRYGIPERDPAPSARGTYGERPGNSTATHERRTLARSSTVREASTRSGVFRAVSGKRESVSPRSYRGHRNGPTPPGIR